MSKIPSVEESLAESAKPEVGRSAKIRNLQWILGGVVVVLAAFGIMQSTTTREVADQKTLAEKDRAQRLEASRVDTPVSAVEIDQVIADQKRLAIQATQVVKEDIPNSLGGANTPGPQSVLLPPLPAVPTGNYPGTTPHLPNDADARTKVATEAAKRDEQIRTSQILAISESRSTTSRAYETPGQLDTVGIGSMTPQGGTPMNAMMEKMAAAKAQLARAQAMDPQAEFQQRLQSSQSGGQGTVGAYGVGAGSGSQKGTANTQWLEAQNRGSTTKALTVERPASQYVVGQGAVIPAILVTGINSDMPGQLTAIVSMDVYDSVRGDQLMIPKGSKLVGLYNNEIKIGQERVLAAFNRLVLPNGSSVDLMGMSGADAQGNSGLEGDVNNHFFKMFAASFMTAGLAQFFQKDQGNSTVVLNGGSSGGSAMTAAGEILVDLSKSINDRNAKIAPTITIQQGHRFNVIVNKDMALSPYRS